MQREISRRYGKSQAMLRSLHNTSGIMFCLNRDREIKVQEMAKDLGLNVNTTYPGEDKLI